MGRPGTPAGGASGRAVLLKAPPPTVLLLEAPLLPMLRLARLPRLPLVALWLALTLCGGALPPAVRADTFGTKALLLTLHVQTQRDAPLELYVRRLDPAGQAVWTPGLELYYEFDLGEPVWKATQVRITHGQFSDSILHRAGYFGVMARWVLWERDRMAWSFQAGPAVIYRQTWLGVPGYDPDNPLTQSSRFPGYEYAVLPMGDFDFLYRFTPELQGVWTIFPGIPFVIVQSLGLRWSF